MKYVEEFRDQSLVSALLKELQSTVRHPARIMEVCGTHTMSIFRHGLRSLLPQEIELISGPGCPVCVTSAGHIDAFIDLAMLDDVTIATFGDLVRVPGTKTSLDRARAEGARVEVVYSPMDALSHAEKKQDREVIFLGRSESEIFSLVSSFVFFVLICTFPEMFNEETYSFGNL